MCDCPAGTGCGWIRALADAGATGVTGDSSHTGTHTVCRLVAEMVAKQ